MNSAQPTAPTPSRSRPAIMIILLLAGAFLLSALYAAKQAQMRAKILATQRALLDEARRNGLSACVAQKADDCYAHADNLRQGGYESDAKFLEANLVFSQYVNSRPLLARTAARYNRDETLPAKVYRSVAGVSIFTDHGPAIDAALYLANNPIPPDLSDNVVGRP